MEKHFLPQKYPDLAGSKPVERAVAKNLREGEPGPENKQERVDTYLDRLEAIVENDHGYELLKRRILSRFTLNVENPETLEKIAEGLYESEKRIAIEQGRGADIQKFGSTQEIVEKYKPLVMEKAEIQRKTLSAWLDYLKQNDSKHPMWFRYFVMRSIEKMGILSKETLEFSKRAKSTVAPFPELNSEALGWVFKKLDEGIDQKEFEPWEGQSDEEKTKLAEKKNTLEKLLNAKDFSKLYAFALVETAGKAMELNGEKIEGEWRKYDQGSDHYILENDLKNKGTGWCTATGSAQAHLQGGDFYVYYLKGENGGYTEPRVAIRMDGDKVGEVRGVNHRQELEPELVDIAQEKYHSLPGGESYDKKASDMKKVTELVKKQEIGEHFSKEDLLFLYEINHAIEGFGYDKDPRIEQLRKQRIAQEDAPVVFERDPSEIAWKKEDIDENTKTYVGPLFEGIFSKGIEHIHTSFPEGKISGFDAWMGGESKENIIRELESRKKAEGDDKIYISSGVETMLKRDEFFTLENKEQVKFVKLKVKDLGFLAGATTDQIYKRAEELGLDLCPPETGPHLRLHYEDIFGRQQSPGDYFWIAMKQIVDSDGSPHVFFVYRYCDGESWLSDDWAGSGSRWDADDEFVFRFRKLNSLES